MLFRRLSIAASTIPLLYLAGCPDNVPGTELGAYEVLATRTAGTCGAWREQGTYGFRVTLTLRPGVLRWAEATGRTINGTVDTRARSFRVSLEESAQLLPPNRVTGYVGCTMTRQDVIDGVFEGPLPDPSTPDAGPRDAGAADAGAADAGDLDGGVNDAGVDGGASGSPPFRGTLSTSFAPAPGSDCSPAVGASATQWAALPCTSTYELRGARR